MNHTQPSNGSPKVSRLTHSQFAPPQRQNEARFRPIGKVSDKGAGDGERASHHALVDDLRALGDGLAGVVGDGVGVAQDRAGHAAAAARLDGLADRAPQPRRHPGMGSRPRRRGEQVDAAGRGVLYSSFREALQSSKTAGPAFPPSFVSFPLLYFCLHFLLNKAVLTVLFKWKQCTVVLLYVSDSDHVSECIFKINLLP